MENVVEKTNILIGRSAIAYYVGVPVRHFRQWVNKYNLPASKGPDNKWRASAKRLDEWVASMPVGDMQKP